MTPILAFDIETVPDVNGIRLLYDLPASLPDDEVVLFAQQKRRAQNGSDFMQHHLHQVVAISCCMRWGQDKIHVGTIGDIGDDEETVIARFSNWWKPHAAAGELERRRFRPARAALPRPDTRHYGRPLLGHGRRRFRRQPRF